MDEILERITINKNLPVPLYFQLKTQLVDLLKEGCFKAGDQLPTEEQFCKVLDISRPTVRQAFTELINEGYITRKRAKGTFVCPPKVEGYFFQKLRNYNEEMASLNLTPSTKVLVSEIIDRPQEYESIYPNSNRIFHLQRLRYADGKEMVLVDTFIPYEKVAGIEKENFERVSLYDIFDEKYHIQLAYVNRSVEAQRAQNYDRKVLGMDDDGVVMHVVTTAYNNNDEIVEYSIAKYRGDRNVFKMHLVKQ